MLQLFLQAKKIKKKLPLFCHAATCGKKKKVTLFANTTSHPKYNSEINCNTIFQTWHIKCFTVNLGSPISLSAANFISR